MQVDTLQVGKHIDANRMFAGFPVTTRATIYDGAGIAAFIVGLNRVSPDMCRRGEIENCLPDRWRVFLDSTREAPGKWVFFAVVHRSAIPRSELHGRVKP